MATQTSQHVRANGVDIHYLDVGHGEPLLLLNNGMVSINPVWNAHPAAYGAFVDTFASHFRVIAPDVRGSGLTTHPDGGQITYDLLADDVVALIDALDLEAPLVCGFSDGGHIASIVGIRNPDSVRAIVNHAGYDLFNPNAASIAMAQQMLTGDLEALFEHPQMGPLFQLMKQDHDSAQGEGHWKTVVAQTLSRRCAYRFEDLARTAAPTLILVGDRDFLCSVEEGATAYRALPDGELAVLPNTGHLITPAAVQHAIEFFERRA